MREHKYRAWDKKWKAMSEPFTLADACIRKDYLFDLRVINGDIEFIEYTGLLDKNGNEIYEGDILGDDDVLGIVAYNQTPDCMYAGSYCIVGSDGYATDWDGVEPENWHDFEVIGNKFENPELLGGDNA